MSTEFFEADYTLHPPVSEALAAHLELHSSERFLRWPSKRARRSMGRLSIARSHLVVSDGMVTAADILSLQPLYVGRGLAEKSRLEALVVPDMHGGVYTARALHFDKLPSQRYWQNQAVDLRVIHVGHDPEARTLEKSRMTVGEPVEQTLESPINLERGDHVMGVLDIPASAEQLEAMVLAEEDVSTRGIKRFLDTYHRLI